MDKHAHATVPPAAPRAVLFDAYGTLFDVYSVGAAGRAAVPRPGRAPEHAVARQADRIHAAALDERRRYRPFWDLTRAGLRYAALRLGLALDAAAEERLMNQYRHLSAFPENREVLQALKPRGIRAGILSNGDPRDAGGGGARAPASTACSTRCSACTSVQRYKTDPAAYALGPQALEPAGAATSCSSPATAGTRSAPPGSATPRCGSTAPALPLEQLDTEPTRIGSSLRDVLDFFPT